MAIDFQDTARELLIGALGGDSKDGTSKGETSNGSKRGLGGLRGLAFGAGAAALAPVAAKNLGKLTNVLGIEDPTELLKNPGQALEGLTGNVGERLGSSIGDKVTGKVDEAGGPSGILKDTVKSALPFGGGDGGNKGGAKGVGQGRRMPVQQSMDIGAPLETVYNQFTQFEQWPEFMHRVKRATQEDDCTVSFAAKIWGRSREFTAEIETQRPNEIIKWKVSQGMTHTGLVTFHELGPRLTRVMVGFDVEPGGMVEKFARGARHIKRAGRGDLHRFKAFIEMLGNETGAWRGVIEDGELVEEHDPSYDEQREYGDASEILLGEGNEGDEEEARSGGNEEEEESRGGRGRSGRSGGRGGQRQRSGRARAASGGSQRSRSASGRQSSGRSSSGGAKRSQSSRGRSSSGSAKQSQSSRGHSSSGGRSSSGGGASSRSSSRASSRGRSSGSNSGGSGRGRSSGSSSGARGRGRKAGSAKG